MQVEIINPRNIRLYLSATNLNSSRLCLAIMVYSMDLASAITLFNKTSVWSESC